LKVAANGRTAQDEKGAAWLYLRGCEERSIEHERVVRELFSRQTARAHRNL
jgi:hypothetical protein